VKVRRSGGGTTIGVKWIVPPTETANSVRQYGETVLDNLRRELEAVARKIEAWAKANHAWQNRTGQAEAGLICQVFEGGNGFKVTLSHTAPHGIWLEVRWGGKYGVIVKAMGMHYGDVTAAMQRAIGVN
jgi:hypothetical protein